MISRASILVSSVLFIACHHASSGPSGGTGPSGGATASDADKQLVRTAKPDKTEVSFTSPTSDQVTVGAKAHLTGTAWDVDLLVNGAVVETVHTAAQQKGTGGGNTLDPIAGVVTVPEGVLFVAGSSKSTGKPDNTYDARVLSWDAGSKQLVVARKIAFEDQWSPDHAGDAAAANGCPASEPAPDTACVMPTAEPNLGCAYPAQPAGAVPHHCMCSQSKWACYPEPAPELP